MKIYRSLRVGNYEIGITYNKSLKQFLIWFGLRNKNFDRFHKNGNITQKEIWKPYINYKKK